VIANLGIGHTGPHTLRASAAGKEKEMKVLIVLILFPLMVLAENPVGWDWIKGQLPQIKRRLSVHHEVDNGGHLFENPFRRGGTLYVAALRKAKAEGRLQEVSAEDIEWIEKLVRDATILVMNPEDQEPKRFAHPEPKGGELHYIDTDNEEKNDWFYDLRGDQVDTRAVLDLKNPAKPRFVIQMFERKWEKRFKGISTKDPLTEYLVEHIGHEYHDLAYFMELSESHDFDKKLSSQVHHSKKKKYTKVSESTYEVATKAAIEIRKDYKAITKFIDIERTSRGTKGIPVSKHLMNKWKRMGLKVTPCFLNTVYFWPHDGGNQFLLEFHDKPCSQVRFGGTPKLNDYVGYKEVVEDAPKAIFYVLRSRLVPQTTSPTGSLDPKRQFVHHWDIRISAIDISKDPIAPNDFDELTRDDFGYFNSLNKGAFVGSKDTYTDKKTYASSTSAAEEIGSLCSGTRECAISVDKEGKLRISVQGFQRWYQVAGEIKVEAERQTASRFYTRDAGSSHYGSSSSGY